MDAARAERMARELAKSEIGGWEVCDLRGHGKSALVFEAERDGQRAALKVFDPELVERFGKETQLQRIEREKRLIGCHHANLIQIIDGGECSDTGHLFVVMELIDAPNLAESLTLVPRARVGAILEQIASAAKFLEDQRLAHRDIKPENIAIFPDFSRAVLLDLGVLRPFGDADLTDEDERVFVGTLRYSSPEFLMREEVDDISGWRALTFYQLGAVLHDLIVRKPLFQEYTSPFSVLVEAVKSQQPRIHATDVSEDLVLLANNCLVKSPATRLDLVKWEDFQEGGSTVSVADAARRRVTKRSLKLRADSGGSGQRSAPQMPARQFAQQIVSRIENAIRAECVSNDAFPRMELVNELSGQMRTTATFDAAVDLGLPRKLIVAFDCELLDQSGKVVSVKVAAAIAADDAVTNPTNRAIVFRGPIDSPTLAQKVADVLWVAMDKAQSTDHEAEGDKPTHWLELDIDSKGDT